MSDIGEKHVQKKHVNTLSRPGSVEEVEESSGGFQNCFPSASMPSFLLCRAPKGRQEFQGWQGSQVCQDFQEWM